MHHINNRIGWLNIFVGDARLKTPTALLFAIRAVFNFEEENPGRAKYYLSLLDDRNSLLGYGIAIKLLKSQP